MICQTTKTFLLILILMQSVKIKKKKMKHFLTWMKICYKSWFHKCVVCVYVDSNLTEFSKKRRQIIVRFGNRARWTAEKRLVSIAKKKNITTVKSIQEPSHKIYKQFRLTNPVINVPWNVCLDSKVKSSTKEVALCPLG